MSLLIRYLTAFPKLFHPKNHLVKVQNFPGGTTKTVLEEMDNLIQRSRIV